MGFLDSQIQNLQRRIKNIEENPRPEYLKSTKVRYEIELENYLDVVDAWKNGKPFAILRGFHQLTHPLGFAEQGYIEWGDRVRDPQKYLNIVVSKFGFPEHSCDRTMTALGLFLSGEVPLPRLMVTNRIPCDPERWSTQAAAEFAGVLCFEVDKRNNCDEENLHCVADEAAELIEFAEKSIPGIKYDEDKLVELLAADAQAIKYQIETYALRARVPCPLSPQDSFRLAMAPSRYSNPHKVVEYARMYRDELFERADKGIGGVKDEKLRIAWLATGPYGRSTFDMLIKKGVSLPWFHYGVAAYNYGIVKNQFGVDSAYGRKLKPLEELARPWNTNSWAGNAAMWVDTLVQACRELKIDACVDFLQPGCVTTKNLKRITAQKLRDELGIPTLDLEGREFFSSEAEQFEMNRKLEEFLDMCIANKK